MLRRRRATAAVAGPLTLLALSWVAAQQSQGALAFAPPLPPAAASRPVTGSACRVAGSATTTALFARKNSKGGGKAGSSGKASGSGSGSTAGKGFGQQANTAAEPEPAAQEAEAPMAAMTEGGEEEQAGAPMDEQQREELKADLKKKMARLGGAIGALAAQVDEQEEEDDGVRRRD